MGHGGYRHGRRKGSEPVKRLLADIKEENWIFVEQLAQARGSKINRTVDDIIDDLRARLARKAAKLAASPEEKQV